MGYNPLAANTIKGALISAGTIPRSKFSLQYAPQELHFGGPGLNVKCGQNYVEYDEARTWNAGNLKHAFAYCSTVSTGAASAFVMFRDQFGNDLLTGSGIKLNAVNAIASGVISASLKAATGTITMHVWTSTTFSCNGVVGRLVRNVCITGA